jgi:serine/threonine-protein kinase
MAEAYRAFDHDTARDVVLKLPHLTIAGDLVAFNLYRREAQLTAGLRHPGLQRLLSDPSDSFMVFEYVEGQSLRAYLSSHGSLPVTDVVQIGLQLTETLEYVHGQGIVHRDLKPENVLIGSDGRVTLTDFGIAVKLTERRLTLSHLSDTVGTPDYMAPEQVRGERGDSRTDIYALGVMLYELLSGEVPYPVSRHAESTHAGMSSEPPLVRRKRADAPEGLEAIIYRALRRRPGERYPSMAALREDLTHLDSVRLPEKYEPDDPPPTAPGDLPPWSTTLRILAIVAGVLLLVGFAAEMLHRGVGSP